MLAAVGRWGIGRRGVTIAAEIGWGTGTASGQAGFGVRAVEAVAG